MTLLSGLYNSRLDTYRIDLLDHNNEFVESLTWSDGTKRGVMPGGSLDLSIYTDTRETAKITVVRDRHTRIPWQEHRLRFWYLGAGLPEPQALATLIPTGSPETYPATHVTEDLELHGLLYVLQRTTMSTTYGIAQGAKVTDAMKDVLGGSGLEDFYVEEANYVRKTSKAWEPGTTRLRILNDLAAGIGYWSTRTDEYGTIRLIPYQPIDQRPLIWTFDDGPDTGLYMPGWDRDRDLLVPNRCIVTNRPEGIFDPLPPQVAVLPPSHPLSFENIHYYYDRVMVDMDYDTPDAGYLLALKYLGSGIPRETRTFTHPWLPGVKLNSVVTHKREGVATLTAPIQEQTIHLQTGGMVDTTIKGGADEEFIEEEVIEE